MTSEGSYGVGAIQADGSIGKRSARGTNGYGGGGGAAGGGGGFYNDGGDGTGQDVNNEGRGFLQNGNGGNSGDNHHYRNGGFGGGGVAGQGGYGGGAGGYKSFLFRFSTFIFW